MNHKSWCLKLQIDIWWSCLLHRQLQMTCSEVSSNKLYLFTKKSNATLGDFNLSCLSKRQNKNVNSFLRKLSLT